MIRRLVLFILVTALLAAAAVWLAERPGQVVVHWLGWKITGPVPLLILALVALLAMGALLVKLARAVVGFPARWLAARRARRTREGYRALSDGLAAVAVGDRRQARKLARRADKLLADHSLTGLLTAQAATLSGDETEAERRLTAMVERPETAFLGLKGLMDLALKDRDYPAALDYARRAWALGGASDGLAATLFDLQARAGQWAEAEATLYEAKKRATLPAGTLARFRALTLLERARQEADTLAAVRSALEAHKADPGFVPAAVMAATLLQRLDKHRKAAAVLTETWRISPHPELVEAHLALAPAETPLARVKRLGKLIKANPDAPDGHIALAEAALAAKLWGLARTHLDLALARRPTAGLYMLYARLEREDRHDEAAAQGWIAKSATAPSEPAWTCGACGKPADRWTVTCPQCGAVDSLDWR
ncbi:MAG TPA: heme biosynthesis HemY N-terminal domain-containing protein [Magnetospirillum sp.]|nr:heme biosynthesis HemY N-terminal domain-containing protein [Magnetospirillum sp.]